VIAEIKMSINYIPFESKSGFISPGFSVNEKGDIVTEGSVTIAGQFNTTEEFLINGIQVLDDSDSVVSLGQQIRNSYLTRLGTLEFLNIDGDLVVAQGSTPYVRVVNGHVEIISLNGTGSIENIDIGLNEPGDANFKSVNIGPGDSSGELTVQGNIGVTGTITGGGDLSINGDISVTSLPTNPTHVTRKDYVDARVTAFAIAFGA
jgi:hypothetical protein